MNIFTLLKTRIVFVSGVAIALITIALVIAGTLMQQEAEARYQAEAFNGKRLLWQRIMEGEFDVMRGELFAITRNQNAMTALAEGNAGEVANQLKPTFNRLKASEIIDGMQILSANGSSIMVRPEEASLVRADGLAKQALNTGKITTGVERDAKGVLNLVFALPVYTAPGKASGILVYTRSLNAVLQEFKRSDGSDIFVVDPKGDLELATDNDLYNGVKLPLPELGQQQFAISEFKGRVFAVLTQPVKGADGKPVAHIVTVSEYTDSYTNQNSIQMYSMIGIALAFVLILVLLSW